MDGFETNEGVIVIAATNRADILDTALLRPGRFDRQIYVHVPDVRGREAILKVHARNKKLSSDINFKQLARLTSGFTGADLENLLNEAAILTARDNRAVTTMADLNEGFDKVILGPQKKSRLVTETDKRIIAFHEAGHAVVAKLLPNCDDVHEVSIIPRGAAGGYVLSRPDNDNNLRSKNKILDSITMTLGGRAAEELIIKDITTGATQDIRNATATAKKMVTEFGMSEVLGNIYLGSDNEVFLGRDYTAHKGYSENMAAIVDKEVKSIIDASYEKAKELLRDNKKIIDNMVRLLYARETIFSAEIEMLFEGKTAEEITEYLEKQDEEKAAAKANAERTSSVMDLIVEEKENGGTPSERIEDGEGDRE
jgi:cell division protease FtsH